MAKQRYKTSWVRGEKVEGEEKEKKKRVREWLIPGHKDIVPYFWTMKNPV